MRAVGRIAWSILRRDLGGFALVAVILGLGLGFSATALAGARRSDSAYTRLRSASRAPDVIVGADGLDDRSMARISRSPEVRGASRFTYTPVAPAPLRPGQDGGAFVGLDPDFLTRVYRPFVVSGRLARTGHPDEVVVNEAMARAARLHPGERVRLVAGFGRAHPLASVTVVGITRGVFDVGANAGNPAVLLGREFLDAHRAQMQLGPQPAALVRVRDPDRDLPALRHSLEREIGHPVLTLARSTEIDTVDRFLAVQTIGLLVLAIAAFLAVVAAAMQALSRRFDRAFVDLPVLVACGLRPRQRYAIAATLAAVVAAVGGAIGVVGSILASPLVPTGFARTVDPRSGVQVDAGAALLVTGTAWLVSVALAFVLARRQRVTMAPAAVGSHETRLARSLPLGPRMGLRAALAPSRAPAGAASRAALVAATVAIAGIVAVGVFATSLTHLLDDRRLQGWSFDVAISREGDATAAFERELAGIDAQPGVDAHGLATVVAVEHGRARYEAFAFDRSGLALHPTLRSGRRLRTDDETVVGRDALTRLGVDVGDTVVLRGPKGRARLHVVGTATYPELGSNSDVGTGISMTLAAARHIGAPTASTLALVRVDGANGYRAVARHRGDGELVRAFRPPRVKSLEEVGGLPTVLAVFLGLLGLVAVAHGMRRSSRERRHDFALLATLGVVRSGLRSIVAWQSLVIACVAVVVGVPVGLIAGRAAWTAVADATGVVDRVAVPVSALVIVASATVLVCLLIGTFAARQAIRPNPGMTLRSE